MLQVKATKNTFDSKEDLKDCGFIWNKDNKCWEKEFSSREEYDEFFNHFNSGYYGRKGMRLHSKVVFEVVEIAEKSSETSEEKIESQSTESKKNSLYKEAEEIIGIFAKTSDIKVSVIDIKKAGQGLLCEILMDIKSKVLKTAVVIDGNMLYGIKDMRMGYPKDINEIGKFEWVCKEFINAK